jgi:hypothetical protein
MQNDNPIRFTLNDNTIVIVKKVADNKYDFELILTSGSRKTFLWTYGESIDFKDKKGKTDKLIMEAVNKFYSVCK